MFIIYIFGQKVIPFNEQNIPDETKDIKVSIRMSIETEVILRVVTFRSTYKINGYSVFLCVFFLLFMIWSNQQVIIKTWFSQVPGLCL